MEIPNLPKRERMLKTRDPVRNRALEKKSEELLYSILLRPQKDSQVRVFTHTKHSEEVKGVTRRFPQLLSRSRLSRQDIWRSLSSPAVSLSTSMEGPQALENLLPASALPVWAERDREDEVKEGCRSPKLCRQETSCPWTHRKAAWRAEVQARRVELRTIENFAQDLNPFPVRRSGFQICVGPLTLPFHFSFFEQK